MNQSLTHNKSSHGRFRGALKSLEKLTALQTLRHVYGTLIEGHEKRSSGHKQPDFCLHSFVYADGNHLSSASLVFRPRLHKLFLMKFRRTGGSGRFRTPVFLRCSSAPSAFVCSPYELRILQALLVFEIPMRPLFFAVHSVILE
jgi:hypothetical protein